MSDKRWLERLRGKKLRGVTVLDRTEVPEGVCQLCEAEDEELRPYGPKGEWICFKCGMKDEKTTGEKFSEIVLGERKQ